VLKIIFNYLSLSIFLIVSVIIGVFGFLMSGIMLYYGVSLFLRLRVYAYEWLVLSVLGIEVKSCFLLDGVRVLYGGVVLLISSVVYVYRTLYLWGDVNFRRFIFLVRLFVGSIFLLIFSPNLIRVLLGWDGLGLVSYCLVIYYQNVKSSSAGIVTVLSNRVGDVAILLSICWLFNFGDWNFGFMVYYLKDGSFILIF